MATERESKGLDLNDALWSAKVLAEQPDVIEQVHYDYFQAGADCAMTASYQATIDGFLKKGYSLAQAEKFITDSVAIAVKARDRFWQDPDNRKGRPYPLIAVSYTHLLLDYNPGRFHKFHRLFIRNSRTLQL